LKCLACLPETIMMYLQNWIPYKLIQREVQPICEWLYTGGQLFTEPFFHETIAACRPLQQNHQRFKPSSSLEWMLLQSETLPALQPTGIIFHVSRCGSTLLSQLLNIRKGNTCLSEVPFFDELLRQPVYDTNIVDDLLRAAVNWHAQYCAKSGGQLFIKTDSWHLFFYDTWRRLFPQTPFFILYRSPAEVLRSQQKKRGMHAVPGYISPSVFGIDESVIRWHDFDHWLCLVMEKYFQAIESILQQDALAIPLHYGDGMLTAMRRMDAACQLNFDEETWRRMEERTRYHGKFPDEVFAEARTSINLPAEMGAAMRIFETLVSANI
jgi:hypothetical protein